MAGRPRRRARLNSAREQNMYSIWIYSGADYDETALAGAAWEVVWADLSYEKELLPEILRQYDPVKDEVSYANSDISYSASAGRTVEKPGFGWRDGVHHNYADDPEHQAEVAAARKRFGPSGMQKLASTNPRSRRNPPYVSASAYETHRKWKPDWRRIQQQAAMVVDQPKRAWDTNSYLVGRRLRADRNMAAAVSEWGATYSPDDDAIYFPVLDQAEDFLAVIETDAYGRRQPTGLIAEPTMSQEEHSMWTGPYSGEPAWAVVRAAEDSPYKEHGIEPKRWWVRLGLSRQNPRYRGKNSSPHSRRNPKKKWGSPQVTVEEPRDLREQVSWRAVIEGTRPDLETELTWRGPTKEPFLSMWADGWRKFKARHDWSGRPLVIHFWQSPSGERSHLKIKDSPLERGAVPLKNPWH